ncbi:hypothetical protein BGX33_005099, partial [Mortierella sp. NVP41]
MSTSSPSHSSRSDGQAPTLDSTDPDPALQQITAERNSLRSQNDQLWKIIEKQRSIIQNLQKDIAKLSSERDLLRHHLTQQHQHQLQQQQQQQQQQQHDQSLQPINANSNNNMSSASTAPSTTATPIAQVNGHHQHSKRSLEQKVQAAAAAATAPLSPPSLALTQPAIAGVPPYDDLNGQSASGALTDRAAKQHQDIDPTSLLPTQPNLFDSQGLGSQHQQAGPIGPAPPFSIHRHQDLVNVKGNSCNNNDNNNNNNNNSGKPSEDSAPFSTSNDDSARSQTNYDPEIQIAATATRIQPQATSTVFPAILIDRDARIIPVRSDSNQSFSGHQSQSSAANSPTASRNVSANLMTGPLSPLMPHLPPRSPRRERRDPGDSAVSPATSDNEDDGNPSLPGHRKKGMMSTKLSTESSVFPVQDQDQPSILSPVDPVDSVANTNIGSNPSQTTNTLHVG